MLCVKSRGTITKFRSASVRAGIQTRCRYVNPRAVTTIGDGSMHSIQFAVAEYITNAA